MDSRIAEAIRRLELQKELDELAKMKEERIAAGVKSVEVFMAENQQGIKRIFELSVLSEARIVRNANKKCYLAYNPKYGFHLRPLSSSGETVRLSPEEALRWFCEHNHSEPGGFIPALANSFMYMSTNNYPH